MHKLKLSLNDENSGLPRLCSQSQSGTFFQQLTHTMNGLMDWGIPCSIAPFSLLFQCSATSFAKGSSGLGALRSACMERRTVRICKAGLHLSEGRRRKRKSNYYTEYSYLK